MHLILKRVAYTEKGTFGVLIDNIGIPFAVTLERPWLRNKKMVSCIPEDTYVCKRVDSPKFGNTFEVTNVIGRSHILFHKGNLDDDSHGCILVGEQFGTLKKEPGILASKAGFSEFLTLLEDVDTFTIEITSI